MDHPVRMGIAERVRDLPGDGQGVLQRELLFAVRNNFV